MSNDDNRDRRSAWIGLALVLAPLVGVALASLVAWWIAQ